MEKGAVAIKVTADDQDARKKLDDLKKDIADVEKQIDNTGKQKNAITASLEESRSEAKRLTTDLENAKLALAEANAAYAANPTASNASIVDSRRRVLAAIESQARDVNETISLLESQEQAVNAELVRQNELRDRLVDEAGELEKKIALASKTKDLGNSFKDSLKGIFAIGFGISSVIALAKKLKEFTVDAVKAFAEANPETKKAIDGIKNGLSQLRAAWGAAFAPIFSAVAPALKTLISWLTRAANSIAMFMAILQGKSSYKRAIEDTEALGGALEETAGAASKAKKQLSGLDEMNLWQGSGGGGSGGGGGGAQYEDVPIEAGDEESGLGKLAAFVRDNLESVELLVDEFLFVIGLILATSGNIPLGLGLMVYAGYKGVKNITENWGAIKTQLQGTMGEIYTVVSTAFLTIGLILLLTGASVPLGLGLMVLGAAGLATAITANWDSTSEKVQHVVGVITGVVSGALLAIGFLLLMSVNPATIALGIGLLAAGAVGLAAAAKLNWESAQTKVGGVVSTITTVVSGALIVLGALLTFSGVNIPLGIALMAAGAVGIAAAATLNWDTIKDALQGPVGEAVAVISGAALLLGILCLLVGLWPLGLGLIAAGAAGLVATAAANWDNLKDVGATAVEKVKEGWESAKETFEMVVEAVKSGAAEVWDAIKTKAETIKKTVETAVKKASTWVANAWTAAQMKAQSITRTVQSLLKKASTWVADAWTAAKMKAQSVTRTVLSLIKKASTWVADAWTAAKMKKNEITRTVKSAVDKAKTWVADAWRAAKMGEKEVTRTVKSAVDKAKTWVADAWTAAQMAVATIKRTLEQGVTKAVGAWVMDAWSAAQKVKETVSRTLEQAVKKAPTWVQEAYEVATTAIGTVKKTVQISIS